MRSLIGFELQKIITRKSTFITALAVFALLIFLMSLNAFQQQYSDENGRAVSGLEAIATHRANAQAQAGLVTDERITADFAEYRAFFQGPDELKPEYTANHREATEEAAPTLSEVSSYENVTFEYLQTFLRPWMIGAWENPSAVIWRVDTSEEIDYSSVVRQSVVNTLDAGMGGTWTYSEAEREHWLSAYDATPQPLEYGYAGGWKTILECFDFVMFILVAICVGITPVFASEYRERTDALILATRYGKSRLVAAKIIAALLFAAGMMCLGLLILIGLPLLFHGAEGGGLPVQLMLVSVPYALSLSQTVLALSGIALIVALGLTAFVLFLSARWRSSLGIVMLSIALVMLPLFIPAPNYGFVAHFRVLMPGMAPSFGTLFTGFISYPLGPIVLDAQTMIVVVYALTLLVFGALAARTFKRHQVA